MPAADAHADKLPDTINGYAVAAPVMVKFPPGLKAILIIGCPRSGTTLLQQLVATCYAGVWTPESPELSPTPHAIEHMMPRDPRPDAALFKVPQLPLAFPDEMVNLLAQGTYVVNIVRDPRSMLTSRQKGEMYFQDRPLGERMWRKASSVVYKLQTMEYARATAVKFEDLLERPADVQAHLAVALELEPTVDFADAWRVMKPGPAELAMNGVRPLDPARAAVDYTAMVEPDTRAWMRWWGYPLTDAPAATPPPPGAPADEEAHAG